MVSLRESSVIQHVKAAHLSHPLSHTFSDSCALLISPQLAQFTNSFSFEFDFRACIHWWVTSYIVIILKCENVVNMFKHMNAHSHTHAHKPERKVCVQDVFKDLNDCSTSYVNQTLLLRLLYVCSCWTEVF